MKWTIHPALILNVLVALWFLYHAILHGAVFTLNNINGQQDSLGPAIRQLIPALIMGGISIAAWWLMHHTPFEKAGKILSWSPIIIVAIYFSWMLILLGSSGGRWN